jgi:hypothetical protein
MYPSLLRNPGSRFNVQRRKRAAQREWSVISLRGLLKLSDLLQDLFIGRPDGVVCFGKLPTYYSLGIDYIGRRMRPAFAVRVEQPIAIDHFMIGISKQGKGLTAIIRRLKFLAQFFRFFMAIDAHRQNLRFRAVLLV